MAKRKTKRGKPTPWNKGMEVGRRDPFSRSEVTRIRKSLAKRGDAGLRDLALFLTAIDTMLRSRDLLGLTVKDVRKRNRVMRDTLDLPTANKGRGIRCTLSETTKAALEHWIDHSNKRPSDYVFTGRYLGRSKVISARQLSRLVKEWADGIGLDGSSYGIESLRRTRAIYILKHTGDLEALRVLLGLTDARSTARYLSSSEPADALMVSRSHEF